VDVLELASYYHIPISSVEKVKNMIQHADPVGVGSKDAREAMLIQIDELKKSKEIPELTEKIITNNFHALFKKQFPEIAQEYGISIKQVEEIADFITENLNPFPARSNWGDVRNPQENNLLQLGTPDIVLSFFENNPQNPIIIEIFQPANSNLVLNVNYHAALKNVDKETKMKMRGDLEKASLFIKCLQQRTNTILRMAQTLVEIQEQYIRDGDKYLKPITRAEIAKKLGVHESTISRAVSSKTIQLTNKKVYPLSVFFDRSLQVRTEIKEIVEKEKEPMSDLEIVKKLAKKNIHIARRTVAKYRDMEGILPAYQRKEKTK
jgi:RNA polymerase sigma-54 factor